MGEQEKASEELTVVQDEQTKKNAITLQTQEGILRVMLGLPTDEQTMKAKIRKKTAPDKSFTLAVSDQGETHVQILDTSCPLYLGTKPPALDDIAKSYADGKTPKQYFKNEQIAKFLKNSTLSGLRTFVQVEGVWKEVKIKKERFKENGGIKTKRVAELV